MIGRIFRIAIEGLNNFLGKICHYLSPFFKYESLSFVVALVAVFISYWTLKESVRQRESMYKPELFIGTIDFAADIRNIHDIRYYRLDGDSLIRDVVDRPWYNLINVGMGSALSVYGNLTFNTDLLMSYFSNNGLKDVKVIKGQSVVDTLVYQRDTITIFNTRSISDWKVDYVLPVNQADKESMQYFPPSVMENATKAFLWLFKEKKNDDIEELRLPVILSYMDINGKWYNKSLEISINFFCENYEQDFIFCSISVGSSYQDFVKEIEEGMDNNN